MRILFAAPRFDYGDPERGLSFEYYNFYDTLVNMGHEVTYFDLMTEQEERGTAGASARLMSQVRAEKPDLLFCVLFTDQLDIDAVARISGTTDTVTFNWFCDDHWRFDNYSRYWAPAFNWVSTTAKSALPKYGRIGYSNVLMTQWACNHFLYRPTGDARNYDVSFVGQPHGNRREVIAELRGEGIDVKTWGYGWETGRLAQDQLIQVFNQSRINLNLSNASTDGKKPSRWIPWRRATPLPSQIKGRNFEVPGCRAFLLTDPAENLSEYYQPDVEIATFTGAADLASKVRLYLEDDEMRECVAEAGYRRTLEEHTYEQRFNRIFSAMGLSGNGTKEHAGG